MIYSLSYKIFLANKLNVTQIIFIAFNVSWLELIETLFIHILF